jgi:hypothetical protein
MWIKLGLFLPLNYPPLADQAYSRLKHKIPYPVKEITTYSLLTCLRYLKFYICFMVRLFPNQYLF